MAGAAIERRRKAGNSIVAPTGRLYDDAGNRMTLSHARKDGVRYRYDVSQALLQHRKADAGSDARVSAPDVETAVAAALPGQHDHVQGRFGRITLHRKRLEIKTAALHSVAARDGGPASTRIGAVLQPGHH